MYYFKLALFLLIVLIFMSCVYIYCEDPGHRTGVPDVIIPLFAMLVGLVSGVIILFILVRNHGTYLKPFLISIIPLLLYLTILGFKSLEKAHYNKIADTRNKVQYQIIDKARGLSSDPQQADDLLSSLEYLSHQNERERLDAYLGLIAEGHDYSDRFYEFTSRPPIWDSRRKKAVSNFLYSHTLDTEAQYLSVLKLLDKEERFDSYIDVYPENRSGFSLEYLVENNFNEAAISFLHHCPIDLLWSSMETAEKIEDESYRSMAIQIITDVTIPNSEP